MKPTTVTTKLVDKNQTGNAVRLGQAILNVHTCKAEIARVLAGDRAGGGAVLETRVVLEPGSAVLLRRAEPNTSAPFSVVHCVMCTLHYHERSRSKRACICHVMNTAGCPKQVNLGTFVSVRCNDGVSFCVYPASSVCRV